MVHFRIQEVAEQHIGSIKKIMSSLRIFSKKSSLPCSIRAGSAKKKKSKSVDSGSKKKVKKNASKEAKKEVEIAPESNATDNDEGV